MKSPEHSSVWSPAPSWAIPSQPLSQGQVTGCVERSWQRTHTHREDHLQVIEHLNLLWESLAAPSHQIVLTVGGRVAVCYRWGIHSKIPMSISYVFSTVVATGDRAVFERAFSLKDKLCWETDIKWGTNYEHMCILAHLSSPTAKNILAQLPSIFAEQLHTR